MDTTKYNLVNQSGVVIDTAVGMGQAKYLYDYHLFGQRSIRIVPASQVPVNLVEIREGFDGKEVSVSLADGFRESIEGLYDLDSALDYGKMHLAYHDNKYV